MVLLLLGCAGWFGQGDSGEPQVEEGDSSDTAETADLLSEDDARVRALTELPEGRSPCRPALLARVTHISDGDTAYMEPDEGGDSMKVRFIGIDTPEIAHGDPAECYAEEAMAYTSATLLNHLVWLSFDAECQDFYDRDLAYVSNGEGEGGFFNRALARNGYATALAIDPNTTYSSVIDDDVAAARQGGLGLWSACADRAR